MRSDLKYKCHIVSRLIIGPCHQDKPTHPLILLECVENMISYVHKVNEEQIITGYPIDGAMLRSGGGRFRELSDVCLHNNAIVARGILVTNIELWGIRTASAPSILIF